MTAATITETGKGTFLVTGDLVFSTVGALLDQAAPMFAARPEAIVDLASVDHCDSAGLVLLLDWVANAAHAGKSIRFVNLPEDLIGIARLSNAETLLPLAN